MEPSSETRCSQQEVIQSISLRHPLFPPFPNLILPAGRRKNLPTEQNNNDNKINLCIEVVQGRK